MGRGRPKKIKENEEALYKEVEEREQNENNNDIKDKEFESGDLKAFMTVKSQTEKTDDDKTEKISKKKKKSTGGFDLTILDKIPVIIINILFKRLSLSELSDSEKKDLQEAFEGVLLLFPENILKKLTKLTPVVYLGYVVYMIVSKRQSEIEANKKKNKTNEQDEDLIKDFQNDDI
jgi:hypothetical protein